MSDKYLTNFTSNLNIVAKHGSYYYLKSGIHRCRNCILRKNRKCNLYGSNVDGEKVGMDSSCPILDRHVQAIMTDVMSLPHIEPTDAPLVSQLARASGFVLIANAYLEEIGLFKVDELSVDVQPLVGGISKYEERITNLCDRLGIGPKARMQLKINEKQKKTFVDYIIESSEEHDEIAANEEIPG